MTKCPQLAFECSLISGQQSKQQLNYAKSVAQTTAVLVKGNGDLM